MGSGGPDGRAGDRRTSLAVRCHPRPDAAPSPVQEPTTDPTRSHTMLEPTAGSRPELLTIAEAAELVRAPVATLRYWRHLGTGPRSFRLGRRVLYRREDVHAWIDAQHGQSTASPENRR